MALAEEEAHNEYSHRSLLLFRREHPLRILAIRVVEGVWFDRLILLLIVANCFSIAISGPQRVRGCFVIPLLHTHTHLPLPLDLAHFRNADMRASDATLLHACVFTRLLAPKYTFPRPLHLYLTVVTRCCFHLPLSPAPSLLCRVDHARRHRARALLYDCVHSRAWRACTRHGLGSGSPIIPAGSMALAGPRRRHHIVRRRELLAAAARCTARKPRDGCVCACIYTPELQALFCCRRVSAHGLRFFATVRHPIPSRAAAVPLPPTPTPPT